MKRFNKLLFLAAAFLLVIPGITLASTITYPINGQVVFDNPATSSTTPGATLDYNISAISTSELLYCYTLTNLYWDPTGTDTPLGIKRIEVPAVDAAGILAAGNAYWAGGTTNSNSITSFNSSPFGSVDDTLEFNYFVETGGDTLDPGESVTFYLKATNHAGIATFKIWDGGNSQNAQSNSESAAVMGPVGNSLTVVPEPGTLLLVGSGLLGLAGLRRRKRSV